MALQTDGILFDTLTVDPSSPSEGQQWYNSTEQKFKVYRNSVVTSFTDAADLSAHSGSTSNPHAVTLEQARQAGATLAGPINMGGFAITNIAQGTNPTDGANRQYVSDQIKSALRGWDWQESVLSRTNTPPGSPVTGARYLITAVASGAWAGKENQIAEWEGAAWAYTVPTKGCTTRSEADNTLYTFDGTTWGNIGGAVSHGSLTNLTADDHTQYLRADGTRTMTGDLALGSHAISGVTTLNGIDPLSHAARHQPNGADPIPTAAASGLNAGSTNIPGVSNSLSRADHGHEIDTATGTVSTIQAGATASAGTSVGLARKDHGHAVPVGAPSAITDATNTTGSSTSLSAADHQHAHGNRGGGTLHTRVGIPANGHGFCPQSNFQATLNPTVNDDGTAGYVPGSMWVNTSNNSSYVCISNATGAAIWVATSNVVGYLPHKAGRVAPASFAGAPRKATVTFATPFADANYSVVITCVTQNNTRFTMAVETQLAGSFVINLGSNVTTNLLYVNWSATKTGEST